MCNEKYSGHTGGLKYGCDLDLPGKTGCVRRRSIGHGDNLAAVLRTLVGSGAESEIVYGVGG